MPCSALTLPPSSSTRSRTASTGRSSSGGGPTMLTWRFPSARWPKTSVVEPGATPETASPTRATNTASSVTGSVTSALCTSPRDAAASECASRQRHNRAIPAGSSATALDSTASPSRSSATAELIGDPGRLPRHLHQHRAASGDGRRRAEVSERRFRGPQLEEQLDRVQRGQPSQDRQRRHRLRDGGHAEQGHQRPTAASAPGGDGRLSRCRGFPRCRRGARRGRSRCCP